MKKNISTLENCYGCGVCAIICPKNIINIIESEDGFYFPTINSIEECINCGLCVKTCAYCNSDSPVFNSPIAAYAGWSSDKDVLRECSSGGIGYEIYRNLSKQNFHGIGVRYDSPTCRASHFEAKDEIEYKQTRGSKYIPSHLGSLKFNKSEKYLVSGTPCQISSFRRYIKQLNIEDQFVLIDFFCHGVPSLSLWDKYVTEYLADYDSIEWRNKDHGWHDSWAITGHHGSKATYQSRWSKGDLFYKFFLGNYCLNNCCYDSCKFKQTKSSADIRLGDLWGNKFRDNDAGVSGILVFTAKGLSIIDSLKSSCCIVPENLTIILEGQMKNAPQKPAIRDKVLQELKNEKNLAEINDSIIKPYRLKRLPQRILNKISYILLNKLII